MHTICAVWIVNDIDNSHALRVVHETYPRGRSLLRALNQGRLEAVKAAQAGLYPRPFSDTCCREYRLRRLRQTVDLWASLCRRRKPRPRSAKSPCLVLVPTDFRPD